MKNLLLPFTLIAFSISQSSYAETSDNKWYVSGSVGYNSVSGETVVRTTSDINIPSQEVSLNEDISWDDDTVYALAFGYSYSSSLRVEVEYSRTANKADSIRLNGTNLKASTAKISSDTIMLNGFYDFNPDFFLKPYLGFGIGMTELEYQATDSLGSAEDTSWEFAIQPLAGLTWSPAANWDIFAQYQYLYAVSPSVNPVITATTSSNSYQLSDHSRQSISLGARYRF